MDQLTDALRDLDPPAPPSSVDLDAVVRRAHRHRLRTRAFVTATVAMVAALAIAVAVPLTNGRGGDSAASPHPVCTPAGGAAGSPTGTEEERVAAQIRILKGAPLTRALDGPLRQALPGATLLDAASCKPGFSFRAERAGFVTGIVVADGAGVAHVEARVSREPAPADRTCVRNEGATSCVREEQQDGTVVYRSRVDYGGGAVLLSPTRIVLTAYTSSCPPATSLQPPGLSRRRGPCRRWTRRR